METGSRVQLRMDGEMEGHRQLSVSGGSESFQAGEVGGHQAPRGELSVLEDSLVSGRVRRPGQCARSQEVRLERWSGPHQEGGSHVCGRRGLF